MRHFRLLERLFRREIYGWVSNENERKDGTYGSILRHARGWLHFDERVCFGVEWSIPSRFTQVGLEFGGYSEHDVMLKIACPLFALWLYAENLLTWEFKRKLPTDHWFNQGRELEIAMHNGGVWFKLWTAEDDSYGRRSRWRTLVLYPADILFGKEKYSNTVLSTHDVVIPMPEGNYAATVKMECAKWTRSRWPFPKVKMTADVDIDKGVPIPGKGENSWDCDDDAIFGMSCGASTVEEAISKVVQSALRTRQRYGGSHLMQPKL